MAMGSCVSDMMLSSTMYTNIFVLRVKDEQNIHVRLIREGVRFIVNETGFIEILVNDWNGWKTLESIHKCNQAIGAWLGSTDIWYEDARALAIGSHHTRPSLEVPIDYTSLLG